MKIRRSDQDGVPILHLEGDFDSFETELVREGFVAALDQSKAVLMDLSKMTFANSTTLAYFITAQNQAAGQGGRLYLVQPTEFIRKTLNTLGFEQVLHLVDSLDEALKQAKAEA